MRKLFLLIPGIATALVTGAQLNINNATFYIGSGATVTVQGDVTSNVDIQGPGTLLLMGSSLQNVDMGGHVIPNLQLNNASNATLLNSNATIGTNFTFTAGKFQLGNLNLTLSTTATVTGNGSTSFFNTNGTGQLIKLLSADISNYELAVGETNNYRPAYLTTSGSTYASAQFGVRVLGSAASSAPPMIASYLKTNWPVTKSGITGGTVSLRGQYIDPSDITGTEANLVGYYNNGTDWSSVGESHNTATNQVGAPVTSASGVVSGFNKFIAVGARAFLQGAYVSGTGLMNDNLRTLPFGPSSSTANFPQDDPYRAVPYSSSFTHVNNPNTETIPNSGVVGAQVNPNDNIVDWVFLELRNLNASPGNGILQTRSALIQKDGDIVDVDGVSPVTFNGIADGNYILSVRHRNHLGLSFIQSAPQSLSEAQSQAYNSGRVFDFRTALSSQLYGTTANYTTASHQTLTTVNLLWGGNANSNTQTRFSGLNNDRDYILITTLGNNPSGSISNVYHSADVNMNKVVRFSGLNNDRDFLLITVLGNNPSASRVQALPN